VTQGPAFKRSEVPLNRPQTAVTVRVKFSDVVDYLRQQHVAAGHKPWPHNVDIVVHTPSSPGSYERNEHVGSGMGGIGVGKGKKRKKLLRDIVRAANPDGVGRPHPSTWWSFVVRARALVGGK
jgi:hypothetical protein